MKKFIAGLVIFLVLFFLCLAAFGWKLTLLVGFFAFLELMKTITGNHDNSENTKGGL